jgi:hypothetical protein
LEIARREALGCLGVHGGTEQAVVYQRGESGFACHPGSEVVHQLTPGAPTVDRTPKHPVGVQVDHVVAVLVAVVENSAEELFTELRIEGNSDGSI